MASSTTSTDASMAFVTVPNEEVANKMIKVLLEAKLVACVNKIPGVESHYWWNNQIESSKELLLMMKTETKLVPELIEVVKKNHPYDVPEVITSPIQQGNPAYLKWIADNVKQQ